jgi:Na+-transporting methylmalonyl-CoA/oxaloacetate decarboxylase gamma subunit
VLVLLLLLLQVFFGKSLETLADLFRGRVKNPGVAVYNLGVLGIGILFVVLSVIYSKRMLRKLEAEELAKEQAEAEAAAAAAAAAEDVEAAQNGDTDAAAPAVADKLRAALPLHISDKAGTAGGSAMAAISSDNAGSASQGDLQVIVADASAAPNSSSLARTPSSNSWIRAGDPETAGSDGGSSGSFMSRMSSVSSFRRLLNGRQQPSAPAANNADLL